MGKSARRELTELRLGRSIAEDLADMVRQRPVTLWELIDRWEVSPATARLWLDQLGYRRRCTSFVFPPSEKGGKDEVPTAT